ncbi:class I SAM-dependent methyltransferase [Marinobacter sp.]|uniref:class I SAM-dependent methyltransferase n=1 Tax=Marinobacter sp. TaxID=50741 RepID=UPI003BA89F1B
MSQNIYDNQAFFDGYAQLPRSQFGLEAAPEWESIQAMLPDLSGKRVIDLGCGYGWFCRSARNAGATEVLGIDLSEKMLARARELTDDSGISYQLGDLEQVALPSQAFDLVYSSLTLHYLPDLAPLLGAIYQTLQPGGWLVFTTEHPIYTCAVRQGWLTDSEGQRSWAVNNYQNEGRRVSNWLADGVIKYHRTLGTTLNALIAAGFVLRHVDEWGPSAEQITATPALAEEAERPMMMLISAQR